MRQRTACSLPSLTLRRLAISFASQLSVPSPLTGVHPDRSTQIEEIKKTTGVTWTAAAHPRFANQAPGASKSLCGVQGSWSHSIADAVKKGEVTIFAADENAAIPDSFDSETNWPK